MKKKQYREQAQKMYATEDLQIADNAKVSKRIGDDGAWVQGWVWVYETDVEGEE